MHSPQQHVLSSFPRSEMIDEIKRQKGALLHHWSQDTIGG